MNPCWRIIAGALGGVLAIAGAPAAVSEDSSQPSSSVGVRIADVPQRLSGDPRAALYIVDHAAPGTRIQRQIEVSTANTSPVTIDLYAGAAAIEDGVFAGAPEDSANELSTWTSINPISLTISAIEPALATVVIDVPLQAPPGEHYAAVWAQTQPPDGASTGVAQISRVGIRIYLFVGPGGAPAADFEISDLIAGRSDDSIPFVLASVQNTGGRALDLLGTLTLEDGPGGLTAGPFPVNMSITLGVGESGQVSIPLDPRIPAGPWDAELTLTSGLVERTVRAQLTFPDSGMGSPVPAQESSPTWLLSPLILVGGVLLGLLGILTWLRHRRRLDAPADGS
jgi:hypothetical protein